jgi:hypothetical protein
MLSRPLARGGEQHSDLAQQPIPTLAIENGVIAPYWVDPGLVSKCVIFIDLVDSELIFEWHTTTQTEDFIFRMALSPFGSIKLFWMTASTSIPSSIGIQSLTGEAGVNLASEDTQFVHNRPTVVLSRKNIITTFEKYGLERRASRFSIIFAKTQVITSIMDKVTVILRRKSLPSGTPMYLSCTIVVT